MTAKEYLGRARWIDRRIEETRERLQRLRAQLEGRVSCLNGMPGGGRYVDRKDEMVDVELRLERQIRDMCRIKDEVVEAIEGVPDPICREVLELYYLDGLPWSRVAERMHYTVRNVQILHGKALQQVQFFR